MALGVAYSSRRGLLRIIAISTAVCAACAYLNMFDNLLQPTQLPEAAARRVAGIPLGRAASAGDVAAVAEFLISDAAAYVTGQTVNIDGGLRHD